MFTVDVTQQYNNKLPIIPKLGNKKQVKIVMYSIICSGSIVAGKIDSVKYHVYVYRWVKQEQMWLSSECWLIS